MDRRTRVCGAMPLSARVPGAGGRSCRGKQAGGTHQSGFQALELGLHGCFCDGLGPEGGCGRRVGPGRDWPGPPIRGDRARGQQYPVGGGRRGAERRTAMARQRLRSPSSTGQPGARMFLLRAHRGASFAFRRGACLLVLCKFASRLQRAWGPSPRSASGANAIGAPRRPRQPDSALQRGAAPIGWPSPHGSTTAPPCPKGRPRSETFKVRRLTRLPSAAFQRLLLTLLLFARWCSHAAAATP